jgi:hypothetical protein
MMMNSATMEHDKHHFCCSHSTASGHVDDNGVDEDFLNELFEIADKDSSNCSDQYDDHDEVMSIVDNDQHDEYNIHNNIHEYGDLHQMTASPSSTLHRISPYSSPSSSPLVVHSFNNQEAFTQLQIPPLTSSSATANIPQHQPQLHVPVVQQTQLQAPFSATEGMVNAYLVVDPVNNVVFFPKQTISCMIGDRIESMEYGPFFLPSFDTNAIAQYTQHVVNPYNQEMAKMMSTSTPATQVQVPPPPAVSSASPMDVVTPVKKRKAAPKRRKSATAAATVADTVKSS